MKRIQQKNNYDCGVAALATLCRCRYDEAFKYLVSKRLRTKRVNSGAIVSALRHFGREPLVQRSISLKDINFEQLTHDALLSCYMWENGKRYGHWAVWDARRRKVLDPYKAKQKLKIRAYLPVR